jgi:seryl-tRNA(Sec) selenium transferase
MERLPDTRGMPDEVVMCRTHRTGYDHAIRAAGARIREVGFNDRAAGAGVRGVEPWELEAAIGERTVAIAYAANPADEPPLADVVEVARRHGLPVLVDAAAQLPPPENLRRFIAAGASLVAFSGGKALRGPQSTGILCGRRDLVAAALLQQLDMDVSPDTWEPPPGLVVRETLAGIPHHGVGRGFKVGKEEICGLVAALERYAGLDHAAEQAASERRLAAVVEALAGVPHLELRILSARETGRRALLELVLDEHALGMSAAAVSRALIAGEPPVHLGERRAAAGVLLVDPAGLRDGDEPLLAARVAAVLRGAAGGGPRKSRAPQPG